ncbi:MAG: GNAT family N-acetyltransferase [Pseudomonadota bacterium]
MSVTIRDAVAADEDACVALLSMLNEATASREMETSNAMREAFRQLMDQARGQIIVAEEAGELLGMATVTYNLAIRYGGEYCQLEELIVNPNARGKNIGALLVEQTVANAKARGCAEYGLYLISTTEHNRAFYEKFGFVAMGTEMRQPL